MPDNTNTADTASEPKNIATASATRLKTPDTSRRNSMGRFYHLPVVGVSKTVVP